MDSHNQIRALLCVVIFLALILIGIGIYSFTKDKEETVSQSAPSNSSPPYYPPAKEENSLTIAIRSSVKISADGKSCTIVVPATLEEGVPAVDSNGTKFVLNRGDEFEIQASGSVNIGSDRPWVGPGGEAGYIDTSVDSPFSRHVGGLEFSIGSLQDNRFMAVNGSHIANVTGIPIFRVIESHTGYHDGNYGSFTVTIKK